MLRVTWSSYYFVSTKCQNDHPRDPRAGRGEEKLSGQNQRQLPVIWLELQARVIDGSVICLIGYFMNWSHYSWNVSIVLQAHHNMTAMVKYN